MNTSKIYIIFSIPKVCPLDEQFKIVPVTKDFTKEEL